MNMNPYSNFGGFAQQRYASKEQRRREREQLRLQQQAQQHQMRMAEQANARANTQVRQQGIIAGANLAIPNANQRLAQQRFYQGGGAPSGSGNFYEQRRQERRGQRQFNTQVDLQREQLANERRGQDVAFDQTMAQQYGAVAQANATAEGFARSKTIEGFAGLGQQQLRNRMDRYKSDQMAALEEQRLADSYDLGMEGYDVQRAGQQSAADTARYQMDATLDRAGIEGDYRLAGQAMEQQGRMDLLARQEELANRTLGDQRAWQQGAVDRAYAETIAIMDKMKASGQAPYPGEEDKLFERIFAKTLGSPQMFEEPQNLATDPQELRDGTFFARDAQGNPVFHDLPVPKGQGATPFKDTPEYLREQRMYEARVARMESIQAQRQQLLSAIQGGIQMGGMSKEIPVPHPNMDLWRAEYERLGRQLEQEQAQLDYAPPGFEQQQGPQGGPQQQGAPQAPQGYEAPPPREWGNTEEERAQYRKANEYLIMARPPFPQTPEEAAAMVSDISRQFGMDQRAAFDLMEYYYSNME